MHRDIILKQHKTDLALATNMTYQIHLITDIFGRTYAVEDLARALSINCDATIVDPYGGQENLFDCEQAAYRYFMEEVTLTRYEALIRDHLKNTCHTSPTFLIGFSVGATAIWNLSAEGIFSRFSNIKILCFYGAQIRHHIEKNHTQEIEVILPNQETSFDVNTLYKALYLKNNVIIQQENRGHGFMNKLSKKFCQSTYEKHINRLKAIQNSLN